MTQALEEQEPIKALPVIEEKKETLIDPKTLVGKAPRMLCTVCRKPDSLAVRYYTETKRKDGTIVRRMRYEHRDEPPVKEYIYKGKKMNRYRTCHAGIVKTLEQALEPTSEYREQEITTKSGVLIAKTKRIEKKKSKTKSKVKQKTSIKSERKQQEEVIQQIHANWMKKWRRLASKQEAEKTKLIEELALEYKKNLVPTNSICNKIVKMCKGIISPDWIRKNLSEEYKNATKIGNAKSRLFRNTNIANPAEFKLEYLSKYNKKLLCSIIEFLVRNYAPDIGK